MTDLERLAFVLYGQERDRGDRANSLLSGAAGKPITGCSIEPWDECKDVFIADARALLTELREPSVEMGMAAFDATADFGDSASLAEEYASVWRAMIDRVLQP